MKRETRERTGTDQCPQCGRFLNPDGPNVYYHCAERCDDAADWDMHPQAAFCNERCADRFHNAPKAAP